MTLCCIDPTLDSFHYGLIIVAAALLLFVGGGGVLVVVVGDASGDGGGAGDDVDARVDGACGAGLDVRRNIINTQFDAGNAPT